MNRVRPTESDDSPFGTVSNVEVSRRERLSQTVDESVLAPLRILREDWRALVGVSIVALYVVMGVVAVVSRSDWWVLSGITLVRVPDPNTAPRLINPFTGWFDAFTGDQQALRQMLSYPFGTDGLGQGLFAQVVHATPAMLLMILSGAVFSVTVATVVGTLAGYKGGYTETVLMGIADIMMTIPGLPLVLLLAAFFQPRNPILIGVLLTINAWAGLARSLRSQVLTIRENSYVESSRSMGLRTRTILRRDIVPNLMPFIAVNFVGTARAVIFSSVGLYFLGVLPFSNLNWGVMMNLAYKTAGALYTWDTAHWLLAPMGAIVLLSLGLILLAQGADRLFNPRIRARHSESSGNAESLGDVADEESGVSAR